MMKIIKALDDIYISLIRNLSGGVGNRLRYLYYKKRLKHMGNDVIIDTGVFITEPQYISIGYGTHIDKNCILVASSPKLDLSNRVLKVRKNNNFKGSKGEVIIGNNCHISQNTMLYGYAGIEVGDNFVMSEGTKIYSLTSMAYNPYDRSEVTYVTPYSGKSPTLMGPVTIEENTFIGIGCIISPGTHIGKNSFAKSYSVIGGTFEDNSYLGGYPAEVMKKRYED